MSFKFKVDVQSSELQPLTFILYNQRPGKLMCKIKEEG